MLSYFCHQFEELSLDQLYTILQLRQEVFIVEQDCPYLDADGKDQGSYHVLGIDQKNRLQAYTRLVPPGISYDRYVSIGRVVTSSEIRGKGQGIPLMNYSTQQCRNLWPNHQIKISAQVYIVKFYESLGFEVVGEEYLEDDIPHIAMVLKK